MKNANEVGSKQWWWVTGMLPRLTRKRRNVEKNSLSNRLGNSIRGQSLDSLFFCLTGGDTRACSNWLKFKFLLMPTTSLVCPSAFHHRKSTLLRTMTSSSLDPMINMTMRMKSRPPELTCQPPTMQAISSRFLIWWCLGRRNAFLCFLGSSIT
jgi:hypothetical protein